MIKLSIKEGQNINTIDQQEALTGGGSKIALKTDKITRGISQRIGLIGEFLPGGNLVFPWGFVPIYCMGSMGF